MTASHPRIFCRTFRCGHPYEFIEIQRDDDGQQVHNLITVEVFQERSQACGNTLEYTTARCLNCARKAKEEDDRDPRVLLERNLGTYQAGASSRSASKTDTLRQNGFDSVLERYKLSGGKGVSETPHPRVTEQEHQVFRLEAQAQARSSGKLVAIPSRRICNAPIQEAGETLLRTRQRYVSCMSEDEDKSLFQPTTDAALEKNCYGEDNNGLSDTFPNNQKGETLCSVSRQQEGNEDKHAKDIVIRKTEVAHSEPTPNPASIHRNPPMSVIKASPLEPEPTAKTKIYVMKDLTTRNEESLHPARATGAPLQDEQTFRPRLVDDFISSGRESALVEHLIDQYASPFEDTPDPPLIDLKHKHTSSVPTVPGKRPLDFIQRRGNTSIRTRSKSDSISRNFHKLRLDLQHSSKATKKTEPDSESPDWACRTSLAIEAGRISMDCVSMPCQESASSKHISRTMRSPTKIVPPERRITQGVRLREPRNVYSSPARRSPEYSPAPSKLGRHSEGACQAVLPSKRLEGVEIAPRKEAPARHDSARAVLLMDLHKKLPPLPSRQDNDEDEIYAGYK